MTKDRPVYILLLVNILANLVICIVTGHILLGTISGLVENHRNILNVQTNKMYYITDV